MSKQVQAAKFLTPARRTTGVPESRERASPRIELGGKPGEPAAVGINHPDPAAGYAPVMDAIGTSDEPAVPLLDKAEAEALTHRIRMAVDGLWDLLLKAHDRQAWKAMGYKTWGA